MFGEDFKSDILIRNAVYKDVQVMGAFGERLVSLHHDWDKDRFFPAGPGTSQAYAGWLADQIGKSDTVVMVAVLNEDVVGYHLLPTAGSFGRSTGTSTPFAKNGSNARTLQACWEDLRAFEKREGYNQLWINLAAVPGGIVPLVAIFVIIGSNAQMTS
jgi:hypothetical protein